MPTHYVKSALVGDEGMDYIALTCSRSNALFIARPRQDIGVDGSIELLNELGEPTGAIVLVQAKSGLSHITSSGSYLIRADRAHFESWSRYSLPVVGIVYNPAARDARWVSISEHLRSQPARIQRGPYNIEAPASQAFTEQGFPSFSAYASTQHRSSPKLAAEDFIERYLLGSGTTREESLTELFSLHRWTPLTCFFIHQMLRLETDPSLIKYLTYLISFYRPYWDRLYSNTNTIPEHLSSTLDGVAQDCLASFSRADVAKILSVVDEEDGLERGGFGNLVVAQLVNIPHVEVMLSDIASDRHTPANVRAYALGILVQYLGFQDEAYLLALLQDEGDSFLIEVVYWALDYLKVERSE